MNEIEIQVSGEIYRLNNNNDKYNRAKKEAGQNASPKQILAYYDKLGGYIQDRNGKKIENGLFWEDEKNNLEVKKKRRENFSLFAKVTSHPVIASLLVAIILAILWYLFGIDLQNFN